MFTVIRIILTLIIFGIIFYHIDWSQLLQKLDFTLAILLLGAALAQILQALICSYRWKLISHGAGLYVSVIDTFKAYIQGMFFNTTLPSTVGGDARRIYLWSKHGLKISTSGATVLTDRIIGAMGAAILSLATLYLLYEKIPTPLLFATLLSGLAIIGIACAWLVMIIFTPLADVVARLHTKIDQIMKGVRAFALTLPIIAISIIMSVFGHIISGISIYLIVIHIGADIGVLSVLGITGAVFILSMIPITVGGWGVREAGFGVFLSNFAMDFTDASLVGLIFGIAIILSSLPGGLLYLFKINGIPNADVSSAT